MAWVIAGFSNRNFVLGTGILPRGVWAYLFQSFIVLAVLLFVWVLTFRDMQSFWVAFLGFAVGGALLGLAEDGIAFYATMAGIASSLILAIALQPRQGLIVNRYR